MIPDDLEQGDTAEVKFELEEIAMTQTIAGFVAECGTDSLTMKAVYPSRTVTYEIELTNDDDEQVQKSDDKGNDLGKFGPVLNIKTAT